MRKRSWVLIFLFSLTTINIVDRVALGVASSQIAREFELSPLQMGYILSSFILPRVGRSLVVSDTIAA